MSLYVVSAVVGTIKMVIHAVHSTMSLCVCILVCVCVHSSQSEEYVLYLF